MFATPNLAGQDGIHTLESCYYPDDLDRLAPMKSRSIHLHKLNWSDMHLVHLVANLDNEVRTHTTAYGADAVLHFVDDTLEPIFFRDVILGDRVVGIRLLRASQQRDQHPGREQHHGE